MYLADNVESIDQKLYIKISVKCKIGWTTTNLNKEQLAKCPVQQNVLHLPA
jgi:tRNA-dihydrouridine synthase